MDKITQKIQNWMKSLDDNSKMRFALNWSRPHSIFKVASKIYDGDKQDLQNCNWFEIWRAKDMGKWANDNNVFCQ